MLTFFFSRHFNFAIFLNRKIRKNVSLKFHVIRYLTLYLLIALCQKALSFPGVAHSVPNGRNAAEPDDKADNKVF